MFLNQDFISKYSRFLHFILVGFICCQHAFAQKHENIQLNKKDWSFIENKGQLADEKGNLLNDILYYGRDGDVNVYCRQQSLSFVFTKAHWHKQSEEVNPIKRRNSPKIEKIDYSRMDMKFIGSNPNATITTGKMKSAYLNFYLAHTPEEGISEVRQFEVLTFHDIYKNIDLVLYAKKWGMKYEFVIHPGGNPDDIRIFWEGTSPEMLEKGGIKYSGGIGSMVESQPLTFYPKGETINSRFVRNNDGSFSFELENFDQNKTVVIDPTLDWATYFGGNDTDYGQCLANDASDNLYFSGYTYSTSGIATSGAYQTSLVGFMDAFVACISKSDSLLWATYYGGNDEDESFSLAVDSSKFVYITGETWSTNGIATSGAYQTAYRGEFDGFIAKFSTKGTRIWGTYFGGYEDDFIGEVKVDHSGNIYISGSTLSTTGISTSGAYQSTLGGSWDAFLAKFNGSGNIQWSTYYGGSGTDYCSAMDLDNSGEIVFGGYTGSAAGIATSGVHQSAHAGSVDIYIAKFSSSGNRIWGTYLGGSGNDLIGNIATDTSGNIIVTGYTASTTGITTSGAHQTTYSGGLYDGLIAKFSKNASLEWATYYGGSREDNVLGVCTDPFGMIHITGRTKSSTGIATKEAWKSTHSDTIYWDIFYSEFSQNGKVNFGTYHGGAKHDNSVFISRFNTNKIYIIGYTTSSSGIATKGAFDTTLGGGEDAFFLKITSTPPGGYDKNLCKGDTTTIGMDSINGYRYQWTSNPSGFSSTRSKPSISPTQTTVYFLKITTDISEIIYDTVTITVKNLPIVSAIADDTTVCVGNYVTLTGSGALNYQWSGGAKNGQKFQITNTTSFIVKGIDAFNCTDTASITILALQLPLITATASADTVCLGDTVILSGSGGSFYTWNNNVLDGEGFVPDKSGSYLVRGVDSNGCANTNSISIEVNPVPNVTIFATDTLICIGNSVTLSGNGAQRYEWSGGVEDGIPFNLDTTTVFTLKGFDNNNCFSTVQITIQTKPRTYLDMISPQTYCCNKGDILLNDSAIAKPTGGVWSCSEKPELIDNEKFNTFKACSPSGSATYTLLYYYYDFKNKCWNSDSTQFTINALPKVRATASQTEVCEGSTVVLSGEGANSYSWDKGIQDGIGFTPAIGSKYTVTGTDTNQCSDTAGIFITVKPLPNVKVNLSGTTISAEQNGALYQWLDCKNSYTPIPGATQQSFMAANDGNYAVNIDLKGCSDTSECVNIEGLDIEDLGDINSKIRVYPNPAKDEIHFEGLTGSADIMLTDHTGRVINRFSSDIRTISVEHLAAGMYYLTISESGRSTVIKLRIE